jgi:hypothetical protein
MRCQHDIGMGGGDRGVKDRAQQGASVGHRGPGFDENMRCPLSIRLRQKKTPGARTAGIDVRKASCPGCCAAP